jgi:hypothetical protein
MGNSPQTQVQALEPAKIATVLASVRQSNTFELTDWQVQSLAKGSLTGNVFRLSGTGTDDGTPAKWSLILKFLPSPASDQTDAIHQFGDESTRWDYWKREVHFYQSNLPDSLPSGLTAPQCYHIEEQPDGFWLWLEDIVDIYEHRWPIARFGLAAQHLGRFNGAYLVGTDIPTYSWLAKDKAWISDWEERIKKADALAKIEQLREEHPLMRRGWPGDIAVSFTRFWQERARFYEVLDSLPKTLQHADCSHKNLMARRDKDGKGETVALDWALLGIGTLGEEIARLVFSTLTHAGVPMTQASELETVVLEGYMRGLQDVGWDGGPKLIRLGYLASMVLAFGFFVTLTPEFIVLANEDNAKRLETMYELPLETVIDNRVKLRRFIAARADEALVLMADLE